MWSKIAFFLTLNFSLCLGAPFVSDPLRNGLEAGRVYMKWVIDLNHDGISDVLLSEKLTPDESKDDPFPDLQGFGVYLGQKGGGYINTQFVDAPGGRDEGGIAVDTSQCYLGYIGEIKSWGIVTALSKWQRSKGIYDTQVVAYSVEGDHIKETYLGDVMDLAKPNSLYRKYLSESRRTKVQLQEVTP